MRQKISGDKAAAIILAGGMSTRMGYDKTGLELDGMSVLSRIEEEYSAYFRKTVFSIRAGDEEKFLGAGRMRELVEDNLPERGPIGGIFSAMKSVVSDYFFITACDMPFPNGPFATRLVEIAGGGFDVVIPRTNDNLLHPLLAVYGRSCLPFIERQLDSGDNKIINFFDKVNVYYIDETDMRNHDQSLSFLENVNTVKDLERVREEYRKNS